MISQIFKLQYVKIDMCEIRDCNENFIEKNFAKDE